MIRVFKRSVWTRDKSYPGGYRPKSGSRKTTVCYVDTEEAARRICLDHNQKRTRKDQPFCEFTSDY